LGGNAALELSTPCALPDFVELPESSGKAGGFPRR